MVRIRQALHTSSHVRFSCQSWHHALVTCSSSCTVGYSITCLGALVFVVPEVHHAIWLVMDCVSMTLSMYKQYTQPFRLSQRCGFVKLK